MYSRTDYNNKKHYMRRMFCSYDVIVFSLGENIETLFILFAIVDNYNSINPESKSLTVPSR